MKRVGIIYGPVGGSTEYVAKKIQKLIGDTSCDLIAAKDATKSDLAKYDNLIFGIATIGNETWNSEPVKSGWFSFMNTLEDAEIGEKTVALFGLGDQIRYGNHFVDAMGDLYSLMVKKSVKVIGSVDPEGYQFTDSKALINGVFVGLPIDEDFESELTSKRINSWVGILKTEFK